MSQILRRRTERLLWIVAAVAIGVYLQRGIRSSVYQWYSNWSFVRTLNGQSTSTQQFALYVLGRSDYAPPGRGNPNMPRPARPPIEFWTARLDIPRIQLSVIVNEGSDSASLARGVGHIEGTPLPGSPGNAGLAAHRDTYFHRLGELKRGDEIRVVTLEGTHSFVVDDTRIVAPDDNEVLQDTGHDSLTLVTCYPFWALGPAPKRYIVRAKLISE